MTPNARVPRYNVGDVVRWCGKTFVVTTPGIAGMDMKIGASVWQGNRVIYTIREYEGREYQVVSEDTLSPNKCPTCGRDY